MKHLLFDALSVNNLSGRHVLLGHVHELVHALEGEWRFSMLLHRGNRELEDALPQGTTHVMADTGSAWWDRARWGMREFDRMASASGVDLVFSPSGMLSPGCSLPQVVLAQNPWPMVARVSGLEALRLRLQRRGFRAAQRRAWRMAYNSAYMQGLYRDTFGPTPRPSVVAYQGIDEALFAEGHSAQGLQARLPNVLAVSVMARHKAIEVLVDAFARIAVARRDARLVLIGSWPEPAYRREVEARIDAHGLQTRIDLLGHVDRQTLHAQYARARAFCLLSRCESFGIPAVEAQAAGTPAVVAAGTAAPEVVGAGGLVVPPDDTAAAVAALSALLDDDDAWSRLSLHALANAQRFRWRACSAPLVDLLRGFGAEQAA